MKITNSLKCPIKVEGNGIGGTIEPEQSLDYDVRMFDDVNITSDLGSCRFTCEYNEFELQEAHGITLDSLGEVEGDDWAPVEVIKKASHAIVLSSGGLDSSVCIAYAVDEYGAENVVTASLYYGQRHKKELECANSIAEHYGLKHIEYDISSAMEHTKAVSSLMEGSDIEISDKSYADQIAEEGKPLTEIPLRNGIFLMIAGSIAMSVFPDEEVSVIYGAHSDDAAGNAYPDCSPEFAAAVDEAIRIGSRDLVHLERPLIHLNKAEVVALGLQLKVPFEKTTSCYVGRDKACGVCGTCRDRIEAFRYNNIIDPVEYEGQDPFEDMR